MSFGTYPQANVRLLLDEMHVSAPCLNTPSQGWLNYPIYGPTSKVEYTNKTITDPSNDVSANSLTSGANLYKITGTPNIGDTLINSAAGTLSWSSSPPSTTAPIIYIYSLADVGGNGSVNAPYKTIAAAVNAYATTTTQKIFVIWGGTYAENVVCFSNSIFVGIGQPTVTSFAFSNAHGNEGLLFEGIKVTTLTATPGSTLLSMSVVVRNCMIGGTLSCYGFDTQVASLLVESSDITNVATNNCNFTCRNSSIQNNLSLGNTGVGPVVTTNIRNTYISTLDCTGTTNYNLAMAGCNIGYTTITGTPTVSRDFISSGGAPVTNDSGGGSNSFLGRTLNSVFVGSGVAVTGYVNSTFLGVNAKATSNAITGSIAIGYNATSDTNNQFALPSTITQLKASGLAGHASATQMTYNTSTGQINYLSSTRAKKEQIENLETSECLDVIDTLCPRSFNWIEDGSRDIGFIAEEAAEVDDLLVARNKDDEIVSVNYFRIITNLVGAVKELKAMVDNQGEIIKSQQMVISNLSKKM